MKPLLTVCVLASLSAHTLAASAIQSADLYEQIKHADKAFFDAFNACDLDTMEGMFTVDLEFYHDLSGVSDFAENMTATKKLCARKLGLTRTLIEASLQVYPVKDFGAIQLGQHTFCHQVDGVDDCGTFGFTNIWKHTDSGWKLHRVASYGH